MRLSTCGTTAVLLMVATVNAFMVPHRPGAVFHRPLTTTLQMSSKASSSSEATPVPVLISGNNIELTDALQEYVNKKMDKVLGKLLTKRGIVRECDVHLSVNKNPKVRSGHTAEVVTSLKGTIVRCAETTPDMYSSIDLVADRLARKLVKYKERKLDGYHGGTNIGENMADFLNSFPEDLNGEEEEEGETVAEAAPAPAAASEFNDPGEPVVTKIKSFDLSKPISVKEAVFALDYIDHDFFVFREKESNEVSVVYKRNAGGVGLIQPADGK